MLKNKTRLTAEDVIFIKNILRRGTTKWKGRAECLRRARKKVFVRIGKKGQEIFKYHYQCASCKQWYRDQDSLEVDHIIEIGTFTGDWNDFIEKVYARPVEKHLQTLCLACHLKKTKKFNAAHLKYQRKK